MPHIEHLSINEKKGEPNKEAAVASFRSAHGIEGDVHAGGGHRQVSLLSSGDLQPLGLTNITSGAFSENLIISGLDFSSLGVGTKLRLGHDVILSITQVGKDLYPSKNLIRLNSANVMARSGLFAQVEAGGKVSVSDMVEVLELVPRNQFQAVVITVSDRCSVGEAIDTAGPAVTHVLKASLQAHIFQTEIVPDDKQTIMDRLTYYSDEHSIDLIITAGGTGPAPRDITPEATREVVDRPMPGFDEAMRYASLAKTPTAMLSRGASGIRKSTLIINLPGSERAAVENLEAILKALPHGLIKLRGHPGDCSCCQERLVTTKKTAPVTA